MKLSKNGFTQFEGRFDKNKSCAEGCFQLFWTSALNPLTTLNHWIPLTGGHCISAPSEPLAYPDPSASPAPPAPGARARHYPAGHSEASGCQETPVPGLPEVKLSACRRNHQ